MRLKELISKLNKISDEYNHDNPNVIIRIGEDMELGKIVDVGDVYACNEAMTEHYGSMYSEYDLDDSRFDNDNKVSRLFEIEIMVEEE